MAALRSLTDDDFDAAYERAEDFGQSVRAEGWYPEWDGSDAAGAVLLAHVDRVISSLEADSPSNSRGGRGLDSPRGGLKDATERSAA